MTCARPCLLLAIAVAVAVAGCPSSSPSPSPAAAAAAPGPAVVTLSGDAWCGSWSATIAAPSASSAARARALRPLVDGAFAELARQIDTGNADSELSAFHTPPERQPRRESAPPPRGTVAQGTALLVDKALALAAATGGAFDPTRPASSTTTTPVPRPTYPRVQVKDGRLHEDGYDVVVDLGDVAGAAAAAAVARVLAENGFADARVVVGAAAARAPTTTRPVATDVVVQREHAQARARRVDGLLDPRTGAPAASGPALCVVDAADAVTAAALARACLVLPDADAKKAAAALGATITSSS